MLESVFNKFADIKSEIFLDERVHHEYFSMKKFYLKNTFLTAEAVVRRCSKKTGVLRNFAKFTGKHLRHRVFLNKVAGLRSATLLKKSLQHGCFPVNFAKFLRTLFFTEHLRWLLL